MNKNTNWLIDSTHSEIAFKVRHMMISTVTGYFEDFQATAQTDGDNFEDAHIEFRAKTASISTKNKDRDAHLQSDDFFNAAEFPELKFTSKSFKGQPTDWRSNHQRYHKGNYTEGGITWCGSGPLWENKSWV